MIFIINIAALLYACSSKKLLYKSADSSNSNNGSIIKSRGKVIISESKRFWLVNNGYGHNSSPVVKAGYFNALRSVEEKSLSMYYAGNGYVLELVRPAGNKLYNWEPFVNKTLNTKFIKNNIVIFKP